MHTGFFRVIAVTAFAAICGTCAAEAPLVLAERGKSGEFSVALPENPTESERFAASELKKYVERLTGVVLDETGSRKIRLVRAEKELGPDGFRLRAHGNDLELSGGRYGLLYAVYEILETYGGVEWFSPECEVVPRLDRLELPANLDRTERPAFEGREVLWSAIAENPDHATRMRLHGIYTGFKPRHAGNIYRFGGGLMNCHTFHKLVPKAKYAKEHPEYFAMRGGKRVTEADEGAGMQLCMSNRDVEDIVVEGILDAIRRDPEATYFGLSQNDNEVYCECPACAAADAEEGTHAGAQMRFVNRVAERIEKVHPDKIIETLAYQYTRKAPKKTRLRKNVMPCLCSIECDFSHPLATGLYSQNVSFREDLRNWAAMTDRLYVWDYTVNFGNYPGIFPNYNVLQPNLKFFRDNGVKSVFEQGAHGGARGAEFEVLKAWLLSKWLWNPDCDEEKLLARFFRGYYGKAAKYVRKYFDVLRALPRPDSEQKGLRVFSSVDSTNLVSDTFLAQASKCWRLAAAAAEKDGRDYVCRNVMLGEFSVDYMRFLRLKNRYTVTPGIRLRTVPPTADGELGDFVDLVKRMKAVLAAEPRVKFSESAGIDKGMKRQIDEALAGLDASKFKPSSRCFLEADRFNLLGAGRTMFREEDAEASEGKCLRVALHKYSWDAQLPVTLATFDPGARYVVRLRAKIELKPNAPEGRVFDCGVHDPQQGKGLVNWSILASQVKSGVWHWYDLGEFLPAGSPYFWMSGGYFDPKKYADNPCAERVFVDRFEIIRKDAVADRRDLLLALGADGCEDAAAREFASEHSLHYVSRPGGDVRFWSDTNTLAEIAARVDEIRARHPHGRNFVFGVREGGAGALAYAGFDSLRVSGVVAIEPKVNDLVTQYIPAYLMPVSIAIGATQKGADREAVRKLVSTLRFWHPGAIYADESWGQDEAGRRAVARKALGEMYFRAEIVGDGPPWRERHKTVKRYLQSPLSERMLIYAREGKIVFGEVEHEHAWTKKYEDLVSHGLWLAGADGTVMDFSKAALSRREDGIPIHSQWWNRDGFRIELEGCSPFGRRESAHLRLRITGTSEKRAVYRGAFFVRTAPEKRLCFDAPDNYQLFIPRENTWRELAATWKAGDGGTSIVDGERFVTFAGDVGCSFDRAEGKLEMCAELSPGETKHLDLVLGRGRREAPDYERIRTRTEAEWKRELSRLEDFFRANDLSAWSNARPLVRNFTSQMLQCFSRPTKGDFVLPRQGGLQRYVWPGDQINVSNALGILGYHEYVEMACDFYFGEYASASGEIGPFANGWANDTASVLDVFSTYCMNCGKAAYWKKHRDKAVRAFRWMKALRGESARDPKQYPGLCPARKSTDWPFVLQDWTFTDCANLSAMEHFASCAGKMGDSIAAEVEGEAKSYRDVIAGIIDRCRRKCQGRDWLRLPLDPRDEHPEWETNRLCYVFAYAYAASTGLVDEKDLLRMRTYMLRHGYASEEGGYSRLTVKHDNWFEHVWYYTWPEQEWVRAWLGAGRRDLARAALDTCLRHIVSDEYVVCESASSRTPWWSPWSPNASGCGRLIVMMSLLK